jgi:hypothetical protein
VGKNLICSKFWQKTMTDSTYGKNMIGSTFWGKNMIGRTFWEKPRLTEHSGKN